MPYFHLLAAWNNQDVEQMKNILSPNIKATFINEDFKEVVLDYTDVIQLLKQRFAEEQAWNFEVIYKAEKQHSNVVVVEIIRENMRHELLEDKALCTFFFDDTLEKQNLIRLDMVMGIKS